MPAFSALQECSEKNRKRRLPKLPRSISDNEAISGDSGSPASKEFSAPLRLKPLSRVRQITPVWISLSVGPTMEKDQSGVHPEELFPGLDAQSPSTADSLDAESRELWRVVSVDGSTRIFQTKPTGELPSKRSSARRVSPCPLGIDSRPSKGLFERGNSSLPTLVAEGGPSPSPLADNELSAELTSVTQAWPSLSPGIRGAVMALIRAASTARPTRQAAAPRRE